MTDTSLPRYKMPSYAATQQQERWPIRLEQRNDGISAELTPTYSKC